MFHGFHILSELRIQLVSKNIRAADTRLKSQTFDIVIVRNGEKGLDTCRPCLAGYSPS